MISSLYDRININAQAYRLAITNFQNSLSFERLCRYILLITKGDKTALKTNINKPLSNTNLKMIAYAAMLADHLCKVLSVPAPVFLFLSNIVGRIAFPIFCFLLADGFFILTAGDSISGTF